MPSLYLVLTILSGLSFTLVLSWVIVQWVRADREADRAERDLEERLARLEARRHEADRPGHHVPPPVAGAHA